MLVFLKLDLPRASEMMIGVHASRPELADACRQFDAFHNFTEAERALIEEPLGDAARSKHHGRKFTEMPRDAAQSIGRLDILAVLVGSAARPGASKGWVSAVTLEVALRCQEALKRTGRPRRRAVDIDYRIRSLLNRLSRQDDPDERRELRRLKRLARREAWLARLKERGETLLTFTEPTPP